MPRNKKDQQQLKRSAGKLKEAREKAGLSQSDLAKKADCSVPQIYHCESGDNWFSWPVYIRACAVLGLQEPPLS